MSSQINFFRVDNLFVTKLFNIYTYMVYGGVVYTYICFFSIISRYENKSYFSIIYPLFVLLQ